MVVTIIIPVFKVEPYIERCLLSVVNQTYPNIEIIFINDCTPDNSISIIEKFVRDNPFENRISIINHQVNKGLSEARNTGINAATGEYIYFLDSDDEITLDCIEVLVANCQGDDFVMGGFLKGDGLPYCITVDSKFEKEDIIEAYFTGKIYDMACNKLTRKSFVINNNLFFKSGLIHEDILWTYQCCMAATSIKILEKPTYFYNIMEGSLNTNFTHRNLSSLEEIYNEIKKDVVLKKNHHKLLINRFLINFAIGIKLRAINASLITFNDFKKISIEPIDVKYESLNLKLKHLLLKSPAFFQYFIIKTWSKIRL